MTPAPALDCGIKVRTELLAEVVKRRKAAATAVPDPGDSTHSDPLSPTLGTAGDSEPPTLPLTSENDCPHPSGTAGDSTPPPHLSPSHHPLGWDRGTAGRNGKACAACGQPMHALLVAGGHTHHPLCEPQGATA